MKISDEIQAIKEKYKPKKEIKYPTSKYCLNAYAFSLGECQQCELCGRQFKDNVMVKESNG